MSNRFDSDLYVANYLTSGVFPKIHDDIVNCAKTWCLTEQPAMDIGACTGLLAARLVRELGAPKVIGIEASKANVEKAVPCANVFMYHMKISESSLGMLSEIIMANGVKVVFARRIFPEISDGGEKLLANLERCFYAAGIEHIILEGRIDSIRSKHKLANADKEVESLSNYFAFNGSYKNVRWLVRK